MVIFYTADGDGFIAGPDDFETRAGGGELYRIGGGGLGVSTEALGRYGWRLRWGWLGGGRGRLWRTLCGMGWAWSEVRWSGCYGCGYVGSS